MTRHPAFVPAGVIPAVLLPFEDDLSIDEQSFRGHLVMSRRWRGFQPSLSTPTPPRLPPARSRSNAA
jgi:hypothetical protein